MGTEDFAKKISNSWQDPEIRAKRIAGMSAAWKNGKPRINVGAPFKFGNLAKEFPIHRKHFKMIHMRVSENRATTDLTNDLEGFTQFIKEIGPAPEMTDRLSVGRKEHSLGYVAGNYMWQSFVENSRESAYRIQPHKFKKKIENFHGTTNGYSNYGCRCDLCRSANAAEWQQRKLQREAIK